MNDLAPTKQDPQKPLDNVFPKNKISPPEYSIQLVQRPELLELLTSGLTKKIISLHAPAGYGKTTILYQFFHQLDSGSDVQVCWLSLEKNEKNSSRFLNHLLRAIESLNVHSENVAGKIEREYDANSKLLQDSVMAQLDTITSSSVIILDDYHAAETEENNQILEQIIGNCGTDVCFLFSSRSKPNIGFSYFKCQGHLLEVNIDHLRFTKNEGLKLFGESASHASVENIFEKTEGWPVVLQLAKLWMLENQTDAELDWQSGNEVVDIADYLSAEILKNLKPEVTEILVDTSILDRINGDLANYITGRTDCWEVFQSLQSLDALLIQISKKGGWFRYHQLFSDFLQSRLDHRGSAHKIDLHKRASDWFLNHADLENAVKHACAAGETSRALEIIEQAGAVRIALTGGMPLLVELLQHLDTQAIYSSPRVSLAKIWILAKQGRVTLARSEYDDSFTTEFAVVTNKTGLDSDLKKESLFVGMMLTEVYEDKDFDKSEIDSVEEMARDASLKDHWFQGWVNNLLCIMHVRRGNLHNALAVNTSAVYHYQQVDSDYGQVFMVLHLSVIHLLSGNLGRAHQEIERAYEWCTRDFSSDSGLLSLIKIVRGTVYFERNQLREAVDEIFPAIDVAEKAEGWVELYVLAYRTAAQLAYASGGIEEALPIINRAVELAKERNLPRLHWQAQCLLAELLTINGQLNRAQAVIDEHNLGLYEPADFVTWREKHLSLLTLSRLSLYSGTAIDLVEDILTALNLAEKYGRQRLSMELSVMLALIYFDLEERDLCVGALRKALHVAVPESYKRCFVKEGAMMARLLKTVIRHVGIAEMPNETVSFLADLLADLNLGETEGNVDIERNILTERELSVLDELAKGSVNKVIARNLDLSLATVKFHLGNIYRKLGVSSRVMAIAVAKKKNLL